MDFSKLTESLQGTLGGTLPNVMGALLILVIGWLVAVIVRASIRRGLGLVSLDQRVESSTGNAMKLESGIASGFYYVILLLVLVAERFRLSHHWMRFAEGHPVALKWLVILAFAFFVLLFRGASNPEFIYFQF